MSESEQRQIFDTWLRDHKGIFFKIVRAYAFTSHDQDDLFQEITLQVWQSILNFRGEAKPSTWIYRVALYAATAWVRQEKRRPLLSSLTAVEHTLTMTDQPRDERRDWLYGQIAKFEPIDRSLCLLMLDGFSYKEIANMLGISASNVGVKIHRIKKQLLQQAKESPHHGV